MFVRQLRQIVLHRRVDNQAAIHLYEKLGFQVEGRRSREFFIDGQFIDTLCMGLEID
ncbi:MAG: GNAT family N-acetyltransferase [Limnochordia bacterium]